MAMDTDRELRKLELVIELERDYLRCCELLRDAERDGLARTIDETTRHLALLDRLIRSVIDHDDRHPHAEAADRQGAEGNERSPTRFAELLLSQIKHGESSADQRGRAAWHHHDGARSAQGQLAATTSSTNVQHTGRAVDEKLESDERSSESAHGEGPDLSPHVDNSLVLTDASTVEDVANGMQAFGRGAVDPRTSSQRFLDTLDHEAHKRMFWQSTRTDTGVRSGAAGVGEHLPTGVGLLGLSAGVSNAARHAALGGDGLARLARSLPLHDRPRKQFVAPRSKYSFPRSRLCRRRVTTLHQC